MIDFSTKFGKRVREQLSSELVVWLTTMDRDGTPQPKPVWFFWDGQSVVIYSEPDTYKVRHIRRNPRVSLHFNTDAGGNEVSVLTGEAHLDSGLPMADKHAEYLEKYSKGIADLGMTASGFAEDYSVGIRVTPAKLRGF